MVTLLVIVGVIEGVEPGLCDGVVVTVIVGVVEGDEPGLCDGVDDTVIVGVGVGEGQIQGPVSQIFSVNALKSTVVTGTPAL